MGALISKHVVLFCSVIRTDALESKVLFLRSLQYNETFFAIFVEMVKNFPDRLFLFPRIWLH